MYNTVVCGVFYKTELDTQFSAVVLSVSACVCVCVCVCTCTYCTHMYDITVDKKTNVCLTN